MACCKRQEVRRVCRPQPSLFSRLNCLPCNRMFFFMVGVGIGVYWTRIKERIAEETKEASKAAEKNKKK
ncbi:uncharacterized protein LOC115620151 [Scaptodrosophila lebanonensis]|uniref:Uncharacterized protein LOC115620151 n=1 Tax=Drosophila lebanonensis TaxID=7225 RepID=A0A6J2T1K7_DROLE|nr:uncharacterized protein LOC115620151 [Scaptodrosophila lebanonensis]